MNAESQDDDAGVTADSQAAGPAAAREPVVDVPEAKQRLNSLIFIINNSLNYLVGPVLYVGVLHAAILSGAGASDTVSNLPGSIFAWITPLPVIVAWLWPGTRHFRRLWVLSYLMMGGAGAVVALLCWAAPPQVQAAGIIFHALCVGAGNGIMNMCQWEMIGRGMTKERKAWTLGFTFGMGPVLAVLGSCVSQVILSGKFLTLIETTPLPKPWSYVALFGATAPAMGIAAIAASQATLPQPKSGEDRRASVADILGGLRQFLTNRLILIALIGFVLAYGGSSQIMGNLGLYAQDAIGEPPENYTGIQMALRFGCKSLLGFSLGWLLAKMNPRAPMLVTTLISLAGIAWALVVPGKWYLISFGFLGAGELFYVYYVNYIVSCSPPKRVRENTAYLNLSAVIVGFFPLLYGAISAEHGRKASFVAAAVALILAAVIVGALLPKQPRAPADE